MFSYDKIFKLIRIIIGEKKPLKECQHMMQHHSFTLVTFILVLMVIARKNCGPCDEVHLYFIF